ncbi:MAG: CCA tRNA nucleotidyltransferase [Planctomycetota bacterium]
MPHEPHPARLAALHAARTLQSAGHTAYFAGGCVRDELLGLVPTDYDIATDARPDTVQDLFRSTAHVGVSFGVVLVRLTPRDVKGLKSKQTVEVATFRADGDYADRRRPDSVTFADEHADAERRDYTINAMFLDPLAEPVGADAAGRLIDHVGGLDDLRAGLVRAVGEPKDRLDEDHLRALRGVRFAARLGFEIEPATRAAIAGDAAGLEGVSRERIGDEVRRMLAHPSRARACGLVRALALEQAILSPAPIERELIRVAAMPPDASVPAALAAWLADRGDPVEHSAGGVQRRLCLSNDEAAATLAILDTAGRARHDWAMLSIAHRKRLAARAGFEAAMVLVAADEPEHAEAVAREVRELERTHSGLAPEPLITGADLVRAGLKPGPVFGRILDAVYDAQLEGRVDTPKQALDMAASLAASLGSGGSSAGSVPSEG